MTNKNNVEKTNKELISEYLGNKMLKAKTSWRLNPSPKTDDENILESIHYKLTFLSDKSLQILIAFCEKELQRREDIRTGTCFYR